MTCSRQKDIWEECSEWVVYCLDYINSQSKIYQYNVYKISFHLRAKSPFRDIMDQKL